MLKSLMKAMTLGLVLAGAPALGIGAASAQTACGTAVTVRAGETLNRIATQCGVPVARILAVNPQITNPNVIHVGQTIRLTGGAVAQPVQPLPPTGTRTYRVRPGDTLASIARRYNVPLGRVIAANPRLNPNQIAVGISIVIPGVGSIGIGTPQPPAPALQTVVGRITDDGVTCLAMRDDRGRLFTLTGSGLRNLAPGDRVEIRGAQARFSICQQGTTIEAREVRRLSWGGTPPGQDAIRVTGVLTNEGVECQAMRGDDGRLYTFPRIGGYRAGDFVEVRGTLAEFSFCQQGTTIDVTRITSY